MLPRVAQTGLFLALSFLLAEAQHVSSPTLKEILVKKGLPVAAVKLANLEKKITSGAELDDASQFVTAYYVDDGTGSLNPPLFVDRYDKKKKEWQSAAFPDAQTKSAEVDEPCLGSILVIKASGGRLLLGTHIKPSAGCLLVLSSELKLEVSLYGWLLGQLGLDLLVYQRSEVHFAPVHPAEIAVYDLRNKRDDTIFPPKVPTPIRESRSVQLQDFYKSDEEWCRKNNDPCDPEYFDSDLEGPVVSSEADSAVAFLISYEQIQFVQGDVQKPSGPKDVLYVYRRLDDPAKIEFREMLWSDVKTQFGDVPLQNLLQPQMLQKIFGESPPKNPKP
jgi:hypothetical protein